MKNPQIKKFLTKADLKEANKNNPCALRICPKCGADTYDLKIAYSKIFITDPWISNCPKCSYSFTD